MGQREAEVVLSCLRENRDEGIRRERLKLVHIEEEIPTLILRHVCPRHRRKLELRDEERTKEVRLVCAELPLGKIGDEDSSVIHHEAGINLALHLSDNVSDVGRHNELTDLVLNRRNRFLQKFPLISVKLVHPK